MGAVTMSVVTTLKCISIAKECDLHIFTAYARNKDKNVDDGTSSIWSQAAICWWRLAMFWLSL